MSKRSRVADDEDKELVLAGTDPTWMGQGRGTRRPADEQREEGQRLALAGGRRRCHEPRAQPLGTSPPRAVVSPIGEGG